VENVICIEGERGRKKEHVPNQIHEQHLVPLFHQRLSRKDMMGEITNGLGRVFQQVLMLLLVVGRLGYKADDSRPADEPAQRKVAQAQKGFLRLEQRQVIFRKLDVWV